MKQLYSFRLIAFAALLLGLSSCGEKTDDFDKTPFEHERLTELKPLVTGKYITYRLDSLVFTNFGRSPEVHSYFVRHVVDGVITDNLGRPSYRIYRYIQDTLASTPEEWTANGSYFVTVLDDQVELVEDNLRIIKLHLPVREEFSWKGNKYLPADVYEPFGHAFSNDDNMKNWDFTYSAPESFSYRGNVYNDVTTVEEEDFSDNVPITLPQIYAIKTRAQEKYAKNIGLVYRDYELWEYQPNPNGNPFYIGFGVKMWMVDHN
jgi:hypothetical protein